MTILDRLVGHDTWTTRQLLLRCRELSEEQMDRTFDIGCRSLRETFAHIIGNMEVWTGLMLTQPIEKSNPAGKSQNIERLLERLTLAAQDLAVIAARVERENRADEMFNDVLDDPPTRKTLGSGIAHLLTHSMHHRAQVLFMLESLGVPDLIEGDVISWERQARGWA